MIGSVASFGFQVSSFMFQVSSFMFRVRSGVSYSVSQLFSCRLIAGFPIFQGAGFRLRPVYFGAVAVKQGMLQYCRKLLVLCFKALLDCDAI